jgi:hypothetical protein
MSRSSRISPELLSLVSDALPIWTSADIRERSLSDVLLAWDRGDYAGAHHALARLDRAVVAGLEALGLGRDPGAALRLDHYGRGWIGRVAIDGAILLDVEEVRHFVAVEHVPDRIFHTLVHESLHARAPATAMRGAEAAQWKGYQEGMVEGLARIVTGERAGIRVPDPAYDYYVAAYRALAAAAGLGTEELWRAVARAPRRGA